VSGYEETKLDETKIRCYNLLRELQKGDLAFKQACDYERLSLQKVWLKGDYAQT
jgi:hypothetical protein